MPKKRLKVLVFTNNPHPQSSAHLVLLNRSYRALDPETHWQSRLKWRDSVIQELLDKGVPLTCCYCGKENLMPFSTDQYKDGSTLDHVVPRCKGGTNMFNNLVISCRRCNGNKGDKCLTPEKIASLPTIEKLLNGVQC